MHLNNMKDNGLPDEFHGIAFDKNIDDNMRKLKEIMKLKLLDLKKGYHQFKMIQMSLKKTSRFSSESMY